MKKLKDIFKKITVIAISLLLIAALSACGGGSSGGDSGDAESRESNGGKETVKIAYLPITHALALFEEAEELQADADSDIEVELVKYGSWPELLDALNAGQVDGASVLIELAMNSKAQGAEIKAVDLGHKDGNVLVTSDEIQSAEDMKGKTFAIPHRQSSHNILLNEALAKGGLTIDDVEVTELAPPEMPSALASGQIDGYCVAEPFGAKSVAIDQGHVLFYSEDLWEDSLCCGLVLTDAFINDRPDTAKAFVKKYEEAGKNLSTDRAKEIAKKYLEVDDDVIELSLQWISYDDLEITEDTYNALIERVKKYGLSDEPPAYEDFVVDLTQ